MYHVIFLQQQVQIVKMSDIKLQTPKFDARFPNVNQTKNCWQNFVDYHKCRKAKGEDYHPCEYFKKTYKSLCPTSWVEDWDDKVEAGEFAGKI